MVEFIFQIAILIMSVVIHEVAHGYMADALGDPTARYEGRLTLNPLKHLDPIGSIVVPILSYLSFNTIFGWAKPVPYNPHNLKRGRMPEVWVALAGPLANVALAVVFAAIVRAGLTHGASAALIHISALIVYVNILLAVFNLMPIPPLDGSRLLFALFPSKIYKFRNFFERVGFLLVILFVFVAWSIIEPLVDLTYHLLTGLSL